jgi:hypothetical protein
VSVTIKYGDHSATYHHDGNGWNSADPTLERILDAFTEQLEVGPQHGRPDAYIANQVVARFPGSAIVSMTPDDQLPPGTVF